VVSSLAFHDRKYLGALYSSGSASSLAASNRPRQQDMDARCGGALRRIFADGFVVALLTRRRRFFRRIPAAIHPAERVADPADRGARIISC